MGTSSTVVNAAWMQALERHQIRRKQGIVTLGVLVGEPAFARALWEAWSAAAGCPCAVSETPPGGPTPPRTGPPPEPGAAPHAARLILPPQTDNDDNDDDDAPARRTRELAALVRSLCGELESMGTPQWAAPLALAVSARQARDYLRDAPDSRAKAIFREGLVVLDSPAAALDVWSEGGGKATVGSGPLDGDAATTAQTANIPPPAPPPGGFFEEFARSHSALAQQRASPRTLASFRAAAADLRATRNATAAGGAMVAKSSAAADQARSAAERFLYDLLNDLPETAGLFALNVKLDFCFGPKPAEVDLLASRLRLAVEIDGYFHFRDDEGYRRDRRKDALLQQQDYFVLRFLAEDVVARLEEILREIRAAVVFRKLTRGG